MKSKPRTKKKTIKSIKRKVERTRSKEVKLVLYNTLGRKKEIFKPIKKDLVGLYTCGLTVYDYAHIGNYRTYIFEDLLKRILVYNGYKVRHVQNVTDVGHLSSDADVGEDKIMHALKREKKPINKESMIELSEKYTKAFYDGFKKLNIIEPDVICKATEHIQEMIELIKRIEKRGYTYKTKVGLIFDTSKFKNYVKLAKLKIKQLKIGASVEKDPERKNPSDFALWIINQPGHIMQWQSPWGKGFPGWHLECSAMSIKYLGEHFDIHCGGIDHIPVHHTNEIAQSEAATGKKWVNYWLHGNFLVMGKEKGKMAKSAGEFITLQDLINKGYEPFAYRYFCLTAHYHSELLFTWQNLDSAKNAFNSLKDKVLEIKENLEIKEIRSEKVLHYKKEFLKFINDDLNTPKSLALFWKMLKDNSLQNNEKYALILNFDKIFGLELDRIKKQQVIVPEKIKQSIAEREEARKNKNFALADKLRDKIRGQGFIIEDTEQGTVIKKE